MSITAMAVDLVRKEIAGKEMNLFFRTEGVIAPPVEAFGAETATEIPDPSESGQVDQALQEATSADHEG